MALALAANEDHGCGAALAMEGRGGGGHGETRCPGGMSVCAGGQSMAETCLLAVGRCVVAATGDVRTGPMGCLPTMHACMWQLLPMHYMKQHRPVL